MFGNSFARYFRFLPVPAALCIAMLATAAVSARGQAKFADLPGLSPSPTNGGGVQTKLQPKAAAAPAALSQTNLAAVALTNGMEALDEKHRLAIGDRISFRVVEDEEDPKPLSVTDSGDLEVPYIGRFLAEGKTCKTLARELKAELEKDYYYKATVIIAVDLMTKSRGKVYLVGPVHMAGPQEIPSDEAFTLSKAILRAGGFGDFADRKNVKVTRKAGGEDKTFTVNVAEILEKGKTDNDLVLEPGDFIYVPERSIRF